MHRDSRLWVRDAFSLRSVLQNSLEKIQWIQVMLSQSRASVWLSQSSCLRGREDGGHGLWAHCPAAGAGKHDVLWVFLATVLDENRVPPCLCLERWKVRTHLLLSDPVKDMGRCTGEAVPYLRGMSYFYDRIEPEHTAAFMHFHGANTSRGLWHAPKSDDYGAVLGLLVASQYRRAVDYGGLYCHWTNSFTEHALSSPAHSLRGVLREVFSGTSWDAALVDGLPDDDFATNPSLHYPCCATFFVNGKALRAWPRRDYERVAGNLIRGCNDPRSPFGGANRSRRVQIDWSHGDGPAVTRTMAPGGVTAGRTIEGAWHMMFGGGAKRVPTPPWCDGKTLPSPYGKPITIPSVRRHIERRRGMPAAQATSLVEEAGLSRATKTSLEASSEQGMTDQTHGSLQMHLQDRSFGDPLAYEDERYTECALRMSRAQLTEDLLLLPLLLAMVRGRPGTFLEMGALDGNYFSTSNLFETCYNWTGVLIEGNLRNFHKLERSERPRATKLWASVCDFNGTIPMTVRGGEMAL